jgi:16S rRNA A1518/A1519 N6-dimethyltransferase RsmA/KsgA/DIM1 with predicted DNA glycosylase/AP lyase activity
LAIELGENFTEFMTNRFGSYKNFQIANADFENAKFDLVYSAAAFQWIREKIGFPKFKCIK